MVSSLGAKLDAILSAPRLDHYRHAANDDLDVAFLYCWNIQFGEALLPTVALLEIVLRNRVHAVLSDHTGMEWWFKSVLNTPSYELVLKQIGDLTKRQGYPPTVGEVLAELTFGFWPKLFAHSYNALWWDAPDRLLAQVLPFHPGVARDTRKMFQERLEYFLVLRNRIMHHEAIFEGVAALNRPRLPIDVLHTQLIETIGWMSPDALGLARAVDRFDDVIEPSTQAVLRQRLADQFRMG